MKLLVGLLGFGLQLRVDIFEFDVFKFGGHFLLRDLLRESKHLVDLGLVFIDGDTIRMIHFPLHEVAMTTLLLNQLSIGLLDIEQLIFEIADCLIQLPDLQAIVLLPLQQFLLQVLHQFLIDSSVLVQHQFLS